MLSPSKVAAWLETQSFPAGAEGRLARGLLIGDWRVSTYLGRGLSAEVYRVTHARYGQEGALKLMTDGSRGLKERFLAEAEAIRFLTLKALPRFMGAGEWEGMPYYVMEYLQPLPDPLPRRTVAPLMNKVAKAVQTLHDAGYIHRDLKPGNILLRSNGEPVLIDLGLIKRRGTGVTDPIVRHGRELSIIDGKPVGVGTLDFAAPEQLLKGDFSVASDIFSLGKILRALYGGRPPTNVKGVIRRATRELPADRYASANDFAAALRHRNLPRLFAAILCSALLSAVCAYPMLRPTLVTLADRFVRHEQPRLESFLRGPDETELSYLNRILPAAKRGNPIAQLSVAEAHFYGRGIPTNRVEAVRWYRLAAHQDEPAAQASLGLCLFRGWGCEKDVAEAVRWYVRAADQGELSAMSNLAFCYLHGLGVDKDSARGFQLAMDAAKRGFASAQVMVGECYLEGIGVEADVERAETWFYRAARLGNRRAMRLLETR